jgi:hypothetical protein
MTVEPSATERELQRGWESKALRAALIAACGACGVFAHGEPTRQEAVAFIENLSYCEVIDAPDKFPLAGVSWLARTIDPAIPAGTDQLWFESEATSMSGRRDLFGFALSNIRRVEYAGGSPIELTCNSGNCITYAPEGDYRYARHMHKVAFYCPGAADMQSRIFNALQFYIARNPNKSPW